MPLKQIDLNKPLPPLEWSVENLILKGYLNMIASLPGQGKTVLLTGLAWQATRANGKFLNKPIKHGASIYVDFDAPGEGRSIRFWLNKHKQAYPDGNQDKIIVLEPDPKTFGMGLGELEQLKQHIHKLNIQTIIIDSFMSAFPNTDPVKLTQVQGPLWYLRNLASETKTAIILIDHLPKPQNGEQAGNRGILGSIAKPAQARTVHLLTKQPKDETNKHILKWTPTKMSYAALPDPFAVELEFQDEAVYITTADLPQAPLTQTQEAIKIMRHHLLQNPNTIITRKELLKLAMQETHLKQRAAIDALSSLIKDLSPNLKTIELKGRGKPIGYKLNRD